MHKRVVMPMLALILSPNVAQAQQAAPSSLACAKALNPTEQVACQGEKFKTAEAELAATLKAALAAIDKASGKNGVQRKGWKSDLRDEHRLWLALREKECVGLIAWEMDRGPGVPAASLGCKVAKTEGRIQSLKARLSLP